MVKGVTVIEAWMDEGSGYCGRGGGIESVSDAAKIERNVEQTTFCQVMSRGVSLQPNL